MVIRTAAETPTGYLVTKIAEAIEGTFPKCPDTMVLPEPGTLQDAARHAEAVADSGIDTSHVQALMKMRNALIRLEKVAEKARKQVVEPALDNEMDVGDSVAGVQRVKRDRITVTDNAAALEMLENAGADPAEVVKIHPRQFVDAVNGSDVDAVNGSDVDALEVIDQEESTFYRRCVNS